MLIEKCWQTWNLKQPPCLKLKDKGTCLKTLNCDGHVINSTFCRAGVERLLDRDLTYVVQKLNNHSHINWRQSCVALFCSTWTHLTHTHSYKHFSFPVLKCFLSNKDIWHARAQTTNLMACATSWPTAPKNTRGKDHQIHSDTFQETGLTPFYLNIIKYEYIKSHIHN